MINYVVGDATAPVGDGPKIITHVCNDVGGWGAGFVMALSARWPQPEKAYRLWAVDGPEYGFQLGSVQHIPVADDLWVANMIAQRGVRSTADGPPIRYDALGSALSKVASFARGHGATVHMPRIGCGLAGGDWDEVAKIVEEELSDIDVTVYDLS